MIFLYSGTPGSGKSLHTADVILHGLQRGRPIICNFDVAHDIKGRKYFTYCPNEKLSPEFQWVVRKYKQKAPKLQINTGKNEYFKIY